MRNEATTRQPRKRTQNFGRGGVFQCEDCGLMTREGDRNAGLDGFCGDCAELAMLQNGFSDTPTEEQPESWSTESRDLRRSILRRGGKINDSMTWAEETPLATGDIAVEKKSRRKDGTPAIGSKIARDSSISSKAYRAREWNTLVASIRDAGGTIPAKGIGWTDAIRAEATRLKKGHLIPTMGR